MSEIKRKSYEEMVSIIGTKWFDWNIIDITESGCSGRYYIGKCLKCGRTHKILAKHLKNNRNVKCRCKTILNNIKGQQINYWTVLEYVGNKEWLCRCKCGTEKVIKTQRLISGDSKSCGCMRKTEFRLSYDIPKQSAEILDSKESLKYFLDCNEIHKISMTELADMLNVQNQLIVRTIKKYELSDYIIKRPPKSVKEQKLSEYISSIYDGMIIENSKNIINPYELDIYIPDKKIAIEFNGNYWHSDYEKDKEYHQNKTIACAKKGIRLIHIFEYEWDTREKLIKQYLNSIINNNKQIVYARNTCIKEVDNNTKKQFLNENHLQGNINSSINYGCFVNDSLIGMMTFGKARNKNVEQYEIYRLCWLSDIACIGGTEKLFNYFLKNINPESIVTYSDISKFTGNVYTRLGFIADKITKPGYVWVGKDNSVLDRTQTQKSKLVKYGLTKYGNTEDEIMKNMNYLKIYNSGNLKLTWRRN